MTTFPEKSEAGAAPTKDKEKKKQVPQGPRALYRPFHTHHYILPFEIGFRMPRGLSAVARAYPQCTAPKTSRTL
jgi:hypothetical protein